MHNVLACLLLAGSLPNMPSVQAGQLPQSEPNAPVRGNGGPDMNAGQVHGNAALQGEITNGSDHVHHCTTWLRRPHVTQS
jgi:hypothetical protein